MAFTQKQLEALFPDPWDPAPTAPTGGLPRMIEIWEKMRDLNSGGYGGDRLVQVDGWAGKGTKTSCSPFTATVIAMMYDAEGGTSKAVWAPKYDNGTKPLPKVFYWQHNGDLHKYYPTAAAFPKKGNKARYNYVELDNSAISCAWWGLGYEIDPRDMRRGDMVGISWGNGNGHATFCWDVHLNSAGAVDAFQYLSSNGNATGGCGVSVGGPASWELIPKSGEKYTKKEKIFENKEKYVSNGTWNMLPGEYLTEKFNPETFKLWPNSISWKGDYSVGKLRVVRFYGFPPPETPHGSLYIEAAEATRMHREKGYSQPPPWSMGTCTNPKAGKAKSKPVPKSNPEPKKAAGKEAVQQKKEDALPHQHWVESSLAELWDAKWIAKDPGVPDSVADAQSKAALEDFQTKWKLSVDGLGSPKTRDALKQAIDDLRAGKPNPNEQNRKPEIEQFYWSPNSIEAGGTTQVGVVGKNLDLVKSYEVTLSDPKSGTTEKVTLEIETKNGRGSASLKVPGTLLAGSSLKVSLSAAGIQKSSNVLLSIKRPAPASHDWPWDEAHWPSHVKDILKQLRSATKGKGEYHRRNITQYGVWDRVGDGDVPILDKKGRTLGHTDKRSLYLADIAGTMRLEGKILNLIESGNVFDPRAGTAIFDRFDPKRSKWIDVCKEAPWGMGAKMPLIPFRTLAYNAGGEKDLYGKKVYIQNLDGLKLSTGEVHNGICIVGDAGSMEPEKQFDLFVGPEGRKVSIPPQCNVEIL